MVSALYQKHNKPLWQVELHPSIEAMVCICCFEKVDGYQPVCVNIYCMCIQSILSAKVVKVNVSPFPCSIVHDQNQDWEVTSTYPRNNYTPCASLVLKWSESYRCTYVIASQFFIQLGIIRKLDCKNSRHSHWNNDTPCASCAQLKYKLET